MLHSATSDITRTFSMTSSKKISLSIISKVSFVMAKVGKVLVIFILKACTIAKVIPFDQIWQNSFGLGKNDTHEFVHSSGIMFHLVRNHTKKILIPEYCNLNSKQQNDAELLRYCSSDTPELYPGQQNCIFLQNRVVLTPHFL